MEKKMYTETLEKVRNDYAVRNIDKLEAAIKAGDMEKALELHKLNVEKKTGFHHFAVRWVNQTLRNFKKCWIMAIAFSLHVLYPQAPQFNSSFGENFPISARASLISSSETSSCSCAEQ